MRELNQKLSQIKNTKESIKQVYEQKFVFTLLPRKRSIGSTSCHTTVGFYVTAHSHGLIVMAHLRWLLASAHFWTS